MAQQQALSASKELRTFKLLVDSHKTDKRCSIPSCITVAVLTAAHRPRDAGATKMTLVDKVTFTLGVVNVAATPYILGRVPQLFYLFYTPKAIFLIGVRYLDFCKPVGSQIGAPAPIKSFEDFFPHRYA